MSENSKNYSKPADCSVDAMGRHYSAICGYPNKQGIPIGSRIRIHNRGYSAVCFVKYYEGHEAIVVSAPRLYTSDTWVIGVRFLEPTCDWEISSNSTIVEPRDLEVLKVGDGTVIPGISYRLCEKEIWDAKYEAYDFTFEGYTNAPTHLAALYLQQDSGHRSALKGMLRKDNTINPKRISEYFRKTPSLTIDDWAPLQGNFPVRSEYRQGVDWDEIAAEFNQCFDEEREFQHVQ
jgi:hypothetical protein